MTPRIRPAVPGDEADVARVHVRAWQAGYRGLLPDAYLDDLRPEDRAGRYTFAKAWPEGPRTLVALIDDRICGFATIAAPRQPAAPAELTALYADPQVWGQGVGAGLEAAARADLVTLGYDRAALWVMAGNIRAQGFYRSRGWRDTGVSRQETVWGATVEDGRWTRDLTRQGVTSRRS